MIEIKNLIKIHHNETQNGVELNNISLNLPDNGFVVVSSENKMGASLVNILSGLESYEGKVLINGVDLNSLREDELFAYRANYASVISETENILEELTVLENIKISLEYNKKKMSKLAIINVLKMFDIEHTANLKLKNLTKEETQKIRLAQAIIKEPTMLFAYEPASCMDQKSRKLTWEVLKKLSSEALVLVITNDEIAKAEADRVITFKDGEIVKDSKPLNKTNSKTYKPMFLEKHGKLSNKNLFRFSFANLKTNVLKSISCVVLAIISLLMFTSWNILQHYNYYDVQANFIKESEEKYVGFNNNNKISLIEFDNLYNQIDGADLYRKINTNALVQIGSDLDLDNPEINKANIASVIEVNSALNENDMFNLEMLYGNYPSENKMGGVVVSDYVADLILEFGAKTRVGSSEELVNLDSYEDFATNQIKIGGNYTFITGVFKTDYLELKDSKDFDINYQNVYSVGFVSAGEHGFVQNLIDSKSEMTDVDLSLSVENKNNVNLINKKVTKSNDLLRNKISVPFEVFNMLYELETSLEIADFVDGSLTFEQVRQLHPFDGLPTVKISVENGEEIEFVIETINSSEHEFVVSENMFEGKNPLAFDDIAFDGIARDVYYQTTEVVVATAETKSLASVLKAMDKLGYNNTSLTNEDFDNFVNKISSYSTMLIICATITAVFAIVLLSSYLSNIIKERNKENSKLRALGVGKRDMLKIMLITTVIFATFAFIGTSLFTGLLNMAINSKMVTGLTYNVFKFNGWNVLFALGSTILLIGIASIQPIIKISKNKCCKK